MLLSKPLIMMHRARKLSTAVAFMMKNTHMPKSKENIPNVNLLEIFTFKKHVKVDLGRWDLENGKKFWNQQEGKNYPY